MNGPFQLAGKESAESDADECGFDCMKGKLLMYI